MDCQKESWKIKNMALGNRISALLGERRESIKVFALNSKISYPTAFNLYHAKSKSTSFEVMNKLCVYFDLTLDGLFPYKPDDEIR